MKKSRLDNPPVKEEVIKRLAVGESQSSIAGEIGLHRSQVSRFAKREDIRPFIEKEQLRLLEAVPDAVENLKAMVEGMKDIPAKETKRLELALKASQEVLKAAGIMPAPQAPLIANIYAERSLILNPIVAKLLDDRTDDLIDITPKSDGGRGN